MKIPQCSVIGPKSFNMRNKNIQEPQGNEFDSIPDRHKIIKRKLKLGDKQ